ncbi:MAG: 1-(5-phosphoribosyl)-5-[(5-phosphoribosylamino)methylideneamino]imidazole-4-carboxamide isomerase [Planctomycetes bacterium]|nr:1-(5-phosphoribosyl)-5-[(5-phosphoribosylamino)methylideneamino]imidazole-4-carboxamide isomerase [Planctomycetota bacterium]
MLIYPAIDLQQGRCVRLRQGRPEASTVFSEDPAEAATRWAQAGAEFLHVVDLDGAFEGQPKNRSSIERILQAVRVPVQVGGGIRTAEAVEEMLRLGVARVILGTAALEDTAGFSVLAGRFPGRIALGLDARDGRVAVKGWAEVSDIPALDLLTRVSSLPLAAVVYTDIRRDGMMAGPNLEATRAVAEKAAVPVIASGGIATLEDVRRLARLPLGGMIIGRALYEGRIELSQAIQAAREARPVAR